MSSNPRLGNLPFLSSHAVVAGKSSSSASPHVPAPAPPPPPPPPPPSNLPFSRSNAGGKKRTSHACDRCRLMRTKCSGGTRCFRCTKDDAFCSYGDHKRERNKRELADSAVRIKELEDDNRDLVAALRSMRDRTDLRPAEYRNISELLDKYSNDELGRGDSSESYSRPSSDPSPKSHVTTMNSRSEKAGEEKMASTVGWPGQQGELHRVIDLDQGAGAAGFIGKMSEISWMQRCREYLLRQSATTSSDIHLPEYDEHASAVVNLIYFVDDVNLLAVDEDHIDPVHWPHSDIAVIMTEAYFHATDGFSEILHREQFLESMYSFPCQSQTPSWKQRRWLALANLVWAIGSRWLQLAKLDYSVAPEDHLTYYARARALGLDHRISFDHPDVEMVQGMGLLAFYLIINGSITRAWNAIGTAVRHAMSLGLHLKVSDPAIDEFEQIRRGKTWFSLYKIEVLIAEITGRPQLIRTAHVTIPLEMLNASPHDPNPNADNMVNSAPSLQARQIWTSFLQSRFEAGKAMEGDDQAQADVSHMVLPGSRSRFMYGIRLSQLSEDTANQLYTGRQNIPWSQTQRKIEELQRGLDAWTGTLPEELRLSPSWQNPASPRASVQLAMYGYSILMMLHRPCLCEIRISDESDQSKEFNITSARLCVKAAMSMVEVMPEEFVPHQVYHLLPWWTLLHYLCQAASVLLLELCLDAQHFQGEAGHLMHAMCKAMAYLACMSQESMSTYKAWRIFDDSLRKVSVRYGDSNLFRTIQQPIPPRSWTVVEENALLNALGQRAGNISSREMVAGHRISL